MKPQDVRLSRYMSLLLRHQPEVAGLVLDSRGWADVGALAQASIAAGHASGRGDLLRVVTENDKRRFELTKDGASIGAAQGLGASMEIKALGPGCANCATLENRTCEALGLAGIEASVEKVTDFGEIASYGIMATPGLVIDEQVVVSGRVPKVDEIRALLASA